MTKPSPKINFDHLSEQKSTTPKEKKKKQKEQPIKSINTREIRYERRTVANFLTFFFFSLFFGMAILLLVVNSRLGNLTKATSQEAIDLQAISQTIHAENTQLDRVKYESQSFLLLLFSYRPEEQARREREQRLQTYLGKNLSAGNLLLHSGKVEREVMDIVLVEAEKGSEDTYELLYRVTYEENGQTVTLGTKLMSTFIADKFQLINIPSVMHIQENEEEATVEYRPKDYHTAGEVVPEEERKQIAAFLERFFDMYVSNDERLSLVSAVEGLGTGEFNQFTIGNLVQIDEDTYAIQGTYTFQIENSQLTSFFDSQIKKNKESYFVEAFN